MLEACGSSLFSLISLFYVKIVQKRVRGGRLGDKVTNQTQAIQSIANKIPRFDDQRRIQPCDWLVKSHNLEIWTGTTQKCEFPSQSQGRILRWSSNNEISPNDSVNYSGWPLLVFWISNKWWVRALNPLQSSGASSQRKWAREKSHAHPVQSLQEHIACFTDSQKKSTTQI